MTDAIHRYCEAYGAGDREGVVSAFALDGSVSFNRSAPIVGTSALREFHEQVGNFNFRIERSYDIDATTQAVEGWMTVKKEGQELQDKAVAFAAIVELTGDKQQMQDLRLYYDVGSIMGALEAAGLG